MNENCGPGSEIEDGFGSIWMTCDDNRCDLEVVRPGKAQCSNYCLTAGWPVGMTSEELRTAVHERRRFS